MIDENETQSDMSVPRGAVRRLRVERRRRVVLWAMRCNVFGIRDSKTATTLNLTGTALSSMYSREMTALNVHTRLQLFMTYLRMGLITNDDCRNHPTVDEIIDDIKVTK